MKPTRASDYSVTSTMQYPNRLRNQYFVMRHGQSEANAEGVIVSDAKTGCAQYGLSDHGKEQVRQSLLKEHGLNAETLIVSSDFKRAVETAGLAHAYLQCQVSVALVAALRERFFGDFNLGSDDQYETVWNADVMDTSHTNWNVESVNSVGERGMRLVAEFEQQHDEKNILLVAHGDVLQILQTAFADKPLALHRSLPHLETAEIRRLMYQTR